MSDWTPGCVRASAQLAPHELCDKLNKLEADKRRDRKIWDYFKHRKNEPAFMRVLAMSVDPKETISELMRATKEEPHE